MRKGQYRQQGVEDTRAGGQQNMCTEDARK